MIAEMAYAAAGGASMQTRLRKTKAAASRTTSKATQEAISVAVKEYVATNHDALMAGLMGQDAAIAAVLAEIDRNLDASEQITARLLAA
jgi:hypothetical protein